MSDEKSRGWINGLVEQYQEDPDFIATDVAIGLMEEASQIMDERGISRAELAQRMGVNRARVTQMLNAPPNLTLRSIAQIAIALGTRPSVHLSPPKTRDPGTTDQGHSTHAAASVRSQPSRR